jgi:hypothetical protein
VTRQGSNCNRSEADPSIINGQSVFKRPLDKTNGAERCITKKNAHSHHRCRLLTMTNKRKAFEIATWPCSEDYVKNPSIILPAFELLTGPEGPSGLNE